MRVPSPAAGKIAVILLMNVLPTGCSAYGLRTSKCTLSETQVKHARELRAGGAASVKNLVWVRWFPFYGALRSRCIGSVSAIFRASSDSVAGQRRSGFTTLFREATEDHLSCRSLVNGSHGDIHVAVHEAARPVHDDHGSIFQVSNALVCLFPFAQNKNAHWFAGEHGWAKRICQLVHVQDGNSLDAGHFVQIELVSDDFRACFSRELHQPAVYIVFQVVGRLQNSHFDMRHLLDTLEHFQPAASALAAKRIGGIGDLLQFVQYKLWHLQRAVEKLCLANVGNAPVNQHAGVEQLCLLRGPFEARWSHLQELTEPEIASFLRAQEES